MILGLEITQAWQNTGNQPPDSSMKKLSCQFRDSHYKDEAILSLYWEFLYW